MKKKTVVYSGGGEKGMRDEEEWVKFLRRAQGFLVILIYYVVCSTYTLHSIVSRFIVVSLSYYKTVVGF